MDASLGFFASASSQQSVLSGLINFSPAGVIQVRDGASFTSSGVPYAAGETLQFRLVENLPATTYSLFVTPPGAAEVPLAINLQVPSDQRGATTLGGWGQIVSAPDGAALAVCNFTLQ
jgi:unsaturated chondroitin disaccharide hydrolase